MKRKDYKKGNLKSLDKHNYCGMFSAIAQVCSVSFTYPDHLFDLFQNGANFPKENSVKRLIYHNEGLY